MCCTASHHWPVTPLSPGDQAVAAGSVIPVTLPAAASLQPHLQVRTTKPKMWLAQNNFRALPHPSHKATLLMPALWGAAGP